MSSKEITWHILKQVTQVNERDLVFGNPTLSVPKQKTQQMNEVPDGAKEDACAKAETRPCRPQTRLEFYRYVCVTYGVSLCPHLPPPGTDFVSCFFFSFLFVVLEFELMALILSHSTSSFL
jgi:hypothetical protein